MCKAIPLNNRVYQPCQLCNEYIDYEIVYWVPGEKRVICSDCHHGRKSQGLDHLLDFLDGYLTWEDMTDDELEEIKVFSID